jgi:hypothetical protein
MSRNKCFTRLEYYMFYVLYPFLTYLLTLLCSKHIYCDYFGGKTYRVWIFFSQNAVFINNGIALPILCSRTHCSFKDSAREYYNNIGLLTLVYFSLFLSQTIPVYGNEITNYRADIIVYIANQTMYAC